MNKEVESKFWLDQVVAEVIKRYPEGEIIVSSGISPSASYHLGHFREILTADAIAWGLREASREARHLHVVDNFDPLRRRYEFLPEEYEQYVGWPICLVPDPSGKYGSYAEYYFREFEKYTSQMGISAEVIFSYEDLYRSGKMAEQIEKVLANLDKIAAIFKKISNRELPSDWSPIQLLTDENKFENADPGTWDKAARTLGGTDYTKGRAKLNWRLDWPARWQVLGVQVEPFGAQEHGAAGGSYETGVAFAKEIFSFEPPFDGGRYGNIHLGKDPIKMSSSKNNLITPAEALTILPPELIRYFVLKSRPEKTLSFDPGLKLLDLYREFKDVERTNDSHEFWRAYQLATVGKKGPILSGIDFGHLSTIYQTAQGKTEIINTLITKLYPEEDVNLVDKELPFVANWLERYAPAEVKFELQSSLPQTTLSDGQKRFLSALAGGLTSAQTPEKIHELIYVNAEASDIKPAEAFTALYGLLLNKTSGPRAGFFLSILEPEFLQKRLRLQA